MSNKRSFPKAKKLARDLTEAEIRRIAGGAGSGTCSPSDCPEGAILVDCEDGYPICLHY